MMKKIIAASIIATFALSSFAQETPKPRQTPEQHQAKQAERLQEIKAKESEHFQKRTAAHDCVQGSSDMKQLKDCKPSHEDRREHRQDRREHRQDHREQNKVQK